MIEKFEKECQEILEDKSFTLMYRIETDGDNDILYVDADLYDVFTYGYADFKFGSKLYTEINEALDKLNVVLEDQGGGVFKFFKV